MGINDTKITAVSKTSVDQAPANGYGKSTCKFWLAGGCNRKHCSFAHHLPNTYIRAKNQYPRNGSTHPYTCTRAQNQHPRNGSTQPNTYSSPTRKSCSISKKSLAAQECTRPNCARNGDSLSSPPKSVNVSLLKPESVEKIKKLCSHWAVGNCRFGDTCKFLHSWSLGADFCFLAKLDGHNKDITGIALPQGSDKLYSGSRDGYLRVWDCHSGKCTQAFDLADEIGSLIGEGPWIFVGMPNVVKAWNVQTHEQLDLHGPVGQVYAMLVSRSNDMLFAGAQDGGILVWKGNTESKPFQEMGSLNGHNLPVLSLVVANNLLYSGSYDHTIRVWEMTTMQCVQTLCGHSDAVMSILCWDEFLFSCSLDHTIKIWARSNGEDMKVIYSHEEENGVLALCGMHDSDAKPILCRSCNDNSVCLYDLPSFSERGRLFSKHNVREIHMGPCGLFFTGDESGSLNIWKWL